MGPGLQDRQDIDGEQRSADPIQADYNQRFADLVNPEHYNQNAADPNDTGSLRNQEESGGRTSNSGAGYNGASGGTSSGVSNKPHSIIGKDGADAAALTKAEGGNNTASQSNAAKGLFKAADPLASSPVALAIGLLSRNKGKGAAGGGVVAIVIAVLVGVGGILPYELNHIEKELLGDVSKVEQHYEKKEAQKDFQKTIARIIKKAHASAAEKATIAAEDAADPLESSMDNFDITSPEVVDGLAKVGIHVEIDSGGNFTGLKDASGTDVTNDIATNDELFNQIESGLPEWDVGQVEGFRSTLVDHANASFEGVDPDTAADDVDKAVETSVEEGASQTEVSAVDQVEESDTGQGPTSDPNPTQTATDQTSVHNEGGAVDSTLSAAEQVEANGGSEADAITAGVDSFKYGDPLFLSAIATSACSFESSVNKASTARVPTITKLLIRHMALLISVSDEIKTGKLKGADIAAIMKLYNGNASLLTSTNKAPPESSLSVFRSAGWQRVIGNKVNTNPKLGDYTPDADKTSLPTANTGTKIVDEINSAMNKSGANLACKTLTSPFGFIVQTALGAEQILGDAASLGGEQVAIIVAGSAFNATLKDLILPDVIKYFLPLDLNGIEDSAQWFNNAHMGGMLSYADYGRSIGAAPLSGAAASAVVASANADELKQDSEMSWSDRTFAVSNPNSLVSRLAFDIPLSSQQAVSGVGSFFTSLPSTLATTFGNLLFPHKASALDSASDPESSYGITSYAFQDSEIGKYDPIDNEHYLESTVSYGGKTAKRIDMAGNPTTGVSNSSDPSTTDLLHCFVNSFDDDASDENAPANITSPDTICGTEGNYDYTKLTPQAMAAGNVATSYCDYLAGSADAGCIAALTPQAQQNDDIGRYRQYLLDTHVMQDYTNLATQTADTSGGSSVTTPSDSGFSWPLGGASTILVQCFGSQSPSGTHPGVDIAGADNTPIYSVADGTVTFAGPIEGYGPNFVAITHTNGYGTSYGHMNTMTVKVGDKVKQGQQIGTEGSQGQSTGPHLHFNVFPGAYSGSDGPNLDPLPFLKLPSNASNPNKCS